MLRKKILKINDLKFKISSFIIIIIILRTQFVTISNWYWVRTLKAQTIKFVERGQKG